MTSEHLLRTPLFAQYAAHGGRTVSFGGWEMPVQFTGIVEEHTAVRERAGLFDVSHMGEIEIIGASAADTVQHLITNDVTGLVPGQALYSPMVNDSGGTVDDVLVYRFSVDRFWIVVNAANIRKDHEWMMAHRRGDSRVIDRSNEIALVSIQGPAAERILQHLTNRDLSPIRSFRFVEVDVDGAAVMVSRTGYTGEDGFEVYCAADDASLLWQVMLSTGQPEGLIPCGLGCRDTLRLEAALPLYGHELSATISPVEAGLDRFIKWEKGDFIGRSALQHQVQQGLGRHLVGLRSLERGIPRDGYTVLDSEVPIGVVTSGTMSPTLRTPIALALVQRDHTEVGRVIQVDIRGRVVNCEIVSLPFYRRPRAAR